MTQNWDRNPEFREVSFREIWNSKLTDLAAGSPFMKFVIYGALLFVIVILAVNSFFLVQPGEEAVLRRFGKYIGSRPSGAHFKIPFVDKVDVVNVDELSTLEFGFRTEKAGIQTTYSERDFPEESEMLTGDMNIVDLEFIVQYRIKSASDYIFNVRNPVVALRDASESTVRQKIGDRGFDEVLSSGWDEITTESEEQIQQLMDTYGTGILVVAIKMQEVNPPARVMSAWDAVNKAQQYKEEMNNQAQQKYNEAIPRAEGHATQIVAKAEAYAIQRTNRAEGEKAKFLSVLKEYEQAPEITRRRLFIETMSEVMTQIQDKIIIDEKVSGSLLNLLDLEGK